MDIISLKNCSKNNDNTKTNKTGYLPRYLAKNQIADCFVKSNSRKLSFAGAVLKNISDAINNKKEAGNKDRTTEESLEILKRIIPNEEKRAQFESELLKNPEKLNTLPLDKMADTFEQYDFMISNLISSNWKPEFKDIPFEKIEKQNLFDKYFMSVLKEPETQAKWSKDELNIIKYGDENNYDSLELLDLDELKKDEENFDIDKCIEYLKKIKDKDVENPEIEILQALVKKTDDVNELKTECPNFVNYLFKNLNKKALSAGNYFGGPFDMENLDMRKISAFDKFLNDKKLSDNLKSLSKVEEVSDTYNSLSKNKNFNNYPLEKQKKILNVYIISNSEMTSALSYMLDRMPQSKAIDEICDNPEKFENNKAVSGETITDKYFSNQNAVDIITRAKVIAKLGVLSFVYPEKYEALVNSTGFEEIKKGNLKCDILEEIRDFDKLDNDFFYKFFENKENQLEREIENSKELQKYDKADLVDLMELAPLNYDSILYPIKNAKDPDLMEKIVKRCAKEFKKGLQNTQKVQENGGFRPQEEIMRSRQYMISVLDKTAKYPELIKKLEPFVEDTSVKVYDALVGTLSKHDEIQQNNIISFVKEYAEKNNKPCNPFFLGEISEILSVSPDFKNTLLDLESELKTNPEVKRFSLEDVVDTISDYNLEFLNEKLKYKSLTSEDIYIMAMAKTVQDFGSKDKNIREKALCATEDIFNDLSRTNLIYGNRLSDLKVFEDLIKFKIKAPEKYEKIKNSGIFEAMDKNNISVHLLKSFTETSDLSEDIYNDLKLIKEGKDIVPSFEKGTSVKEVFSKTKVGDVAEIGDKLFINDGNEMIEWKMTKEKYLELFPPVQRFMNEQGAIGDCYLVSPLGGIMHNPKTRVKLYQSFEQNGNDINVTVKGYEEYKGTRTFKDGQIIFDNEKKHLEGCKGLQMYEQAYAYVAFRSKNEDPLLKLNDKTDKASLMRRLKGGHDYIVHSEILNIDNMGAFIGEKNDKIKIRQEYKYIDKEDTNKLILVNKTDKYSIAKTKDDYDNEKELENDLIKLNSGDFLIGFSVSDEGDDFETLEKKYDLFTRHAYSVVGYDKETKTVRIANPHNFSVTVDMPLEDFYKIIDDLYLAKHN